MDPPNTLNLHYHPDAAQEHVPLSSNLASRRDFSQSMNTTQLGTSAPDCATRNEQGTIRASMMPAYCQGSQGPMKCVS
ncbi:MAG: hypothetical protein FRX48_01437 [Lasallia pustulata]|uniref:Uncharacterized protein n=1 Tax=Lasallia pustulata TaxID=136370 RepID=A0A5M8PZ00_9LECA|nr:MAG: hypothetical protein FRX48_01437 [Lasallia pustulata]